MKTIIAMLTILLTVSCTKQKLDCHNVIITRFDSRTAKTDTTLNGSVCGNGIHFLKKDGTYEFYSSGDSMYYYIYHVKIEQ